MTTKEIIRGAEEYQEILKKRNLTDAERIMFGFGLIEIIAKLKELQEWEDAVESHRGETLS